MSTRPRGALRVRFLARPAGGDRGARALASSGARGLRAGPSARLRILLRAVLRAQPWLSDVARRAISWPSVLPSGLQPQ
eukprot:8656399-Pyramimonas_sp.AAC.1